MYYGDGVPADVLAILKAFDTELIKADVKQVRRVSAGAGSVQETRLQWRHQSRCRFQRRLCCAMLRGVADGLCLCLWCAVLCCPMCRPGLQEAVSGVVIT